MEMEIAWEVLGPVLGQGRAGRGPLCTSQFTQPFRRRFPNLPLILPILPPLTMRDPGPERTGSMCRARRGGLATGAHPRVLGLSGCCCPPGSAGPEGGPRPHSPPRLRVLKTVRGRRGDPSGRGRLSLCLPDGPRSPDSCSSKRLGGDCPVSPWASLDVLVCERGVILVPTQ